MQRYVLGGTVALLLACAPPASAEPDRARTAILCAYEPERQA